MRIPNSRHKVLERLSALAREQRWQELLDLARAALRRWPRELALLEGAAMAARHCGHAADAAQYWKRLVHLDPTSDHARMNCSGAMLDAGDIEAAAAMLGTLSGQSRLDPLARFIEARIAHATGRLGEAQQAYEALLVVRPALPEAWVNLASVQHESGERVAAERSLLRALALRPDYPRALSNLSNLLREDGRAREALARADAALAIAPDFEEAWLNRGSALRALGEDDLAASSFGRIAQSPSAPGLRALINLAVLELDRGNLEAAEARFDGVILANPTDPVARYNRSLLLLRRGRFEEGWPEHEARLEAECMRARVNCRSWSRRVRTVGREVTSADGRSSWFPNRDSVMRCSWPASCRACGNSVPA